ncbi:DUF3152 domain-containing protein [Actinomycetospora lemnae]|uniref:DUF3152 domain-containing protein n=1 Tax=Actinomycetospora lemnae TaxID=3019891 RepID=A0ABT5SSW2_9PSEU|nr:DUF3152 domain-containing protein [Actinomycetospora sp. DW7H6]MDD7965132.1 DUF3152 domain-containing protein [Actinomycetospora sp. DW7H6]
MTRPARRPADGEEAPADSPLDASPTGDGRAPRAGRPGREPTSTAVRDRPRTGSRPGAGSRPATAPRGRAGARPPARSAPRKSVLRSWRTWVIPALVVLTVLAVVEAVSPDGDAGSASPLLAPPERPTPVVTEAPRGVGQNVDIPSAELPAGGAFPVTGSGTWHVVPGTTPQAGTGRVYTYTVEVEDGIVVPEGEQAYATAVDATLTDPRSWIGSGQIAVRRIDTGVPDFRVSLSAQMTIRGLCGYSLRYEASCWKSDIGRVLINGSRWVRGGAAFEGQLGLYRQYALNHEVGHVFDNPHVPCPENGALAPIMMQQSFGTANDYLAQLTEENPQGTQIPRDGKVCRPNAWPYPQGPVAPVG